MTDFDFIIAHEDGDLSDNENIRGFQQLIDSGLVWELQGYYGRMARDLIDAGYCTVSKRGVL